MSSASHNITETCVVVQICLRYACCIEESRRKIACEVPLLFSRKRVLFPKCVRVTHTIWSNAVNQEPSVLYTRKKNCPPQLKRKVSQVVNSKTDNYTEGK